MLLPNILYIIMNSSTKEVLPRKHCIMSSGTHVVLMKIQFSVLELEQTLISSLMVLQHPFTTSMISAIIHQILQT